MKNISERFLSENYQFLEVKFSIYLNRRVFVMKRKKKWLDEAFVIVFAVNVDMQNVSSSGILGINFNIARII